MTKIYHLGPNDVHLMKALLTVFGTAFDDEEF
jgi:hypothetical protein